MAASRQLASALALVLLGIALAAPGVEPISSPPPPQGDKNGDNIVSAPPTNAQPPANAPPAGAPLVDESANVGGRASPPAIGYPAGKANDGAYTYGGPATGTGKLDDPYGMMSPGMRSPSMSPGQGTSPSLSMSQIKSNQGTEYNYPHLNNDSQG